MKWKHAIQKFIQPEDSAGRALCELERETSTHLFLFCVVDRGVWNLVMRWIYFWFITPSNFFMHLECWSREASNEKLRKGYWLI